MGTGSLSLSCWGSSSLNFSMGDINKIERERETDGGDGKTEGDRRERQERERERER